ncbi:MAG: hypothetical protein SVX38_08940, partial [Chloroflexota bacterium]|nr:hypothetical protein [Chloroflexota bacterium]
MADNAYDVDREQQIATALKLGISAAQTGRRHAAQRHLRQVLRLAPDNVPALLWLAGLAEDTQEALDYVQRALAVAPNDARALAALEWAQQRMREAAAPEDIATPPALPFTETPSRRTRIKQEESESLPAEEIPHRVPAQLRDLPPPFPVEPSRSVRTSRLTWRIVLRNAPFLIGLVIVLALLFLALFGPRLATYNPYLTSGRALEMVDGRLSSPPFPPSEKYPLGTDQWGRDI